MKKPYLKNNNEQGFSLIEFIVVLVIFSIMSGTSLFNFNKYQTNIQETNIAQDIALTLRQAQIYGLSGSDRIIGRAVLDNIQIASEVFDNQNNNNSLADIVNIAQDRSVRGVAIITNRNELIIFEDINRNFRFDQPTSNNQGDRIIDVRSILSRDIKIAACLITISDAPGSPLDCSEEVKSSDIPINIAFQRPYPDATIEFDGNTYGYVYLKLTDNNFTERNRYVEISPIGNISVRSYE
jgi:prepilin-type N-terminal cleavage/methylation domain-containing protein